MNFHIGESLKIEAKKINERFPNKVALWYNEKQKRNRMEGIQMEQFSMFAEENRQNKLSAFGDFEAV